MSQEGVVGGKDVSNYERYNFRINSEHKIFKDSDLLKVGEQVSFVYKMNNGISVSDQYNNTLRGAFATSPLAPNTLLNFKFLTGCSSAYTLPENVAVLFSLLLLVIIEP